MKTISKTRSFLLSSLTAGLLLVAHTAIAATILVPAFVKDPVLLKRTMAACGQNPGELAKTPNCVNASAADQELFVAVKYKAGVAPCFKDRKFDVAPDAKCVDAYFEKKAK